MDQRIVQTSHGQLYVGVLLCDVPWHSRGAPALSLSLFGAFLFPQSSYCRPLEASESRASESRAITASASRGAASGPASRRRRPNRGPPKKSTPIGTGSGCRFECSLINLPGAERSFVPLGRCPLPLEKLQDPSPANGFGHGERQSLRGSCAQLGFGLGPSPRKAIGAVGLVGAAMIRAKFHGNFRGMPKRRLGCVLGHTMDGQKIHFALFGMVEARF